MKELRKRTIRTTVRFDETCIDAITRYMTKHGYDRVDWIDGKGLSHTCYVSNEYELWVAGYTLNSDTCVFTLDGNKKG